MYHPVTSSQETNISNESVTIIRKQLECTNDVCRLKAEYRILKAEAGYWKIMHHKAVVREQVLKQKNEELEAKLRLRERQLFGRKTEKKAQGDKTLNTPNEQKKRPRGQQKGAKGHGRKCHDELPAKEEVVDLPEGEKQCPCCGLPLTPFPGTEDSEIIEINVRAYRRIIKRKRYTPKCRCTLPGIITAPPPKRLIPKGKLGISVWVNVLLDKFLYYRPTYRLLAELESLGLSLSQGTVTGGLKYIKSLFEPIKTAIVDKNRTENRWHADETRWQVFEEVEGKVGYRWWLWVFISSSTVVYILDPSRSAEVPKKHFKGIKNGILSVDRYSAYKVLLKDGRILLAFCWAHVRRDFLSVAKDWPTHEAWAMTWVSGIAELYRLNKNRLDVQKHQEEYPKANKLLKAKIEEMEKTADEQHKMDIHPACNKVLKSLKEHWKGLTLFVEHPEVPMDNNISERKLRGPAMGRKNYYGAGKKWSGLLAVNMFTIFQTVLLWNLNPRTWLNAYLQACADNNNQPPTNINDFLPWKMSETQRHHFSKPPSWNDSS